MAKFFESFPRILYDIQGAQLKNFQLTVNIFYRLRFLRDLLGNISAYYEYNIMDSDTPEILADNIYGDPEAHWIILMANEMVDPQYDWPLNGPDFYRYITDKYTSVENAQITIHHYEKVIQRQEQLSGITTETRFEINYANLASELASSLASVPYDYYTGLADEQSVTTINMGDGKTVTETVSREAISNYDYEVNLNESKRRIKLIKPEYYPQVMEEFRRITNTDARSRYIRKLI